MCRFGVPRPNCVMSSFDVMAGSSFPASRRNVAACQAWRVNAGRVTAHPVLWLLRSCARELSADAIGRTHTTERTSRFLIQGGYRERLNSIRHE
jgi:hypothetical protein